MWCMWLAIHSAEAHDLVSAADPVICETLDSLRSSSRSSSPLHGAAHLAADLPYVSACSFPATLLLSGI